MCRIKTVYQWEIVWYICRDNYCHYGETTVYDLVKNDSVIILLSYLQEASDVK